MTNPEPTIPLRRKNLRDVYVHSTTYEGEALPVPSFEGQRHASLLLHERYETFDGSGAKFYVAEGGEWKEIEL